MVFNIENIIFKEDFDVNLYCSLKFAFGIKIEEKLIGNCNICIDNLFDVLKLQDEKGNHFSFDPSDGEVLRADTSTATIDDQLELIEKESESIIVLEENLTTKQVTGETNENQNQNDFNEPHTDFNRIQPFNDNSLINCTEKGNTNKLAQGIIEDDEESDSTFDENINITKTINDIQESVTFEDETIDSVELKVEEDIDIVEEKNTTQVSYVDESLLTGIDNAGIAAVKNEDNTSHECTVNLSMYPLPEDTTSNQDSEKQTNFDDHCENNQVITFVGNPPSRNVNSDIECDTNMTQVSSERLNQSFSNFQCKECGKFLSSKGSLKRHIHCMHKEIKLFECKECDCYFMQKIDLLLHINSFHEKIIQYKCKECGKVFLKKHHLQRHEEIHIGIKPFECQVCGKSFMFKYHLTQHQMIHAGIKPHKCKVCEKSFILKASLYRHEQIHSGKKPFKCKECGKSFSQNSYLLEHQNVHSNVKYQCDQCDKCFSRKSYLSRHKKIHGGAGS